MARKDRTPPPPRRVQAPKPRPTGGGRPPIDRRAWTFIGAVALLFVGAGAAIGLLAFGGKEGPGSAAAELRDAGCILQTFRAQGRQHVTKLPKNFKYNSFPPTTGLHNPQPAPFDVYEEPVEQMRLVHNLEHGGVAIQYGDQVPRTAVDAIVDWYRQDPNGIVIAPLPALGKNIALTAWTATVDRLGAVTAEQGVLAKCPAFDEAAFDAYVKAYAFKGPERLRKEDLAPGQ